jgi:hypothetical protein
VGFGVQVIVNPESLKNDYYVCNKMVANYLGKNGELFLSMVGNKYYFICNDHLEDILKKNFVLIKILEMF